MNLIKNVHTVTGCFENGSLSVVLIQDILKTHLEFLDKDIKLEQELEN